MAGSSISAVWVAVSNNEDIVDLLLTHKFHKVNLDDKLFDHKLRPCPAMRNLSVNKKTGNRLINITWFDKYEWLIGSETRNKLYCWNDLLFAKKSYRSVEFDRI